MAAVTLQPVVSHPVGMGIATPSHSTVDRNVRVGLTAAPVGGEFVALTVERRRAAREAGIIAVMTIENWHTAHLQTLTRGQRAADLMRNGMGSWAFIGSFVAAMLLWAGVNSVVLRYGSWDPYPYILLNLFLSMLAGLQGAILLIAAKRQDGISSAMAQHDFDTNVASKMEIDRLVQLSEQHKVMISDLHDLIRNHLGLVGGRA